ncbi:chromosome segregation ATPase [Paenibacillus sp. 2TAF8]|jgi:chromosome segregation ATPase|uniref:chromosome segregation ATPase n=1 Tax=Paenibacillus sp. 2TAF8 TaxID=3233020 RepID=UPI003F9A2F92
MPSIAKIRFTHVLYEGGNKRYNDEIFWFDGHNGAILLENGGGKTVFIQTALQAMLPHTELAGRKLKDTLLLENGPAHVAIEWILNDKPRRRYAITCVSLFLNANGVDSYRYAYEYGEHDAHGLEHVPFVREYMGKTRPADKGEMQEYYSSMAQRFPLTAQTFGTLKEYKAYLEENFHIIASEWEAVAKINSTEGGIENFFDDCKSTSQLFDRLLIPTVEEAMEGFEQGSYVDIFNSHREGFKRYKELKEQIEENKLILQELSQYVRLYEGLHQAEEEYDEARAEAKAYQSLAWQQREEKHKEQTGLAERLQLWTIQQEELQMQLKSFDLAEAEQEQFELVSSLAQLQEETDMLNKRLQQAARTFYSLKYAEHRVSQERAEARLQQVEQQLARLEQSEDEQQLQERWEHTGGELRTAFAREDEDISAFLKEHDSMLNSLQSEEEETKKTMERLSAETRKWELKLLEKQTQLDEKKEQQQKIARAILANPSLEKVEEQIPIWSARQQQLETKRIEHIQQIKQITEEQGIIRDKRQVLEGRLRETEREKARLEQQQEQRNEEHNAVVRELGVLRPNWEMLNSVYDKEASITERLQEGIRKRQEQKTVSLHKERLAYRYVDDYNEQDVFFADPVIERFVKAWSRQLSLLQTGTEYVRGLNVGDGIWEQVGDRLWSVTLVTTQGEKLQLMQKLVAAKDEFAYPIRVLSTGEAAALMQGSGGQRSEEQWVVPTHWQDNEEEAAFQQWKTSLLERAEQTRQERENREEELMKWQHVEQHFKQFLRKYPLSESQALEQQLHASRQQLIRYSQELQQCEQRSRHLEESIDKYRTELSEMQDVIHQLGVWLKEGHSYIILGVDRNKLEKELEPIRQQLYSLQKQLRTKKYGLTRIHEEQTAVQHAYHDANTRLQLLRNDHLYRKAQEFAYADSSRSMTELKEEYSVLELQRSGIMKERNHLEMEQSHEREKRSLAQKGMLDLLREHSDLELDTALSLPVELEKHKQAAWLQIERYRDESVHLIEQLQKMKHEIQNIEGRITILRQQFSIQFPEKQPVRFDNDLKTVQSRLQQENEKLKQEKKEWQQRRDAVERQIHELDRVLQLWDKHTLVHRLHDERIPSAHLEERRVLDFTYARLELSERAVTGLQSCLQRMEREQGIVHKGKDSFKNFCISRIKDVKLRQMAIQGIELKLLYSEVTEFRETMETRIQKAIHIMEETIQTYDRDLQEFIQRIHTHMKRIVQELKELPKKTRIKSADGWREIFSFSIPEWEEQDGKDRIRSYMEWILSQLESSPFNAESVHSQDGDVRKRLEKWLDSRQLLQVVLKGEAMKVSCRKVTNDHQITKASYSWEQSNRWSGGEKWSKNMTLFLGLLNYVAERRQYIKANMKLHRTVILDNPFGKASSDHVLSPVFFIAEQLGFQIIALTAHAEGKFLQDYFPIVYSCRLRSTMDASKQIIEPTKRVQHAYFRDQAPETLERIDAQVNQMELF